MKKLFLVPFACLNFGYAYGQTVNKAQILPNVFDVNMKIIGELIGPSTILFKLPGGYISVAADQSGFTQIPPQAVLFFHTSSDCSGQRYLDGIALTGVSFLAGNTLYYTQKIAPPTVLGSQETFGAGANVNQAGNCLTLPQPVTFPFGPAKTISISALGYTPPFSVLTPKQ